MRDTISIIARLERMWYLHLKLLKAILEFIKRKNSRKKKTSLTQQILNTLHLNCQSRETLESFSPGFEFKGFGLQC